MTPWTQRLIDDVTARSPWLAASRKRGRANICRALQIDHTDPIAGYATAPFVCVDHDDITWIAGAIGYTTFDEGTGISDIILWQPTTGVVRLFGEAANIAALITPATISAELTIFVDPRAFFRAWADRRAEFLTRRQIARETTHSIIPSEPLDGNLPGALAIGDIDAIHWLDTGASVLKAGPGVDAKKLQRGVFRSARLPRVVAADERLAA
jgi:hypothetical protein